MTGTLHIWFEKHVGWHYEAMQGSDPKVVSTFPRQSHKEALEAVENHVEIEAYSPHAKWRACRRHGKEIGQHCYIYNIKAFRTREQSAPALPGGPRLSDQEQPVTTHPE